MALPTENIFLRSPYFVNKTETDLNYIRIDLRIWNGLLEADEPLDPTIRLRSTALNGYAYADIAEFARDYVEVTFSGTQDSSAVFISYELTYILSNGSETTEPKVFLIGLDGYSTFPEGTNFQFYNDVALSSEEVNVYSDSNANIPVFTKELTGWDLESFSSVTNPPYNSFRSVSVTPLGDEPPSSINTSDVVRYVDTSYQSQYADRVVFHFSNAPDEIVYVNYIDCNRYGLTRVYFVNRYGCLQELHLSGKFEVGIKGSSNKFTRNLLDNGEYSVTRHQKSILNKNGNIFMSLNTGWLSEEENDSFIQLVMSEQVWIDVDVSRLGLGWLPKQASKYTIPVNITSESMNIKNRLNDKLINYSFEFEAASDWINNVR